MSESGERVPEKPKAADTPVAVQVSAAGCTIVVAAGFVFLMFGTCRKDQAVSDLGRTFLSDLRAGKTQDAYARLSGERRAAMPFPEFEGLTNHRAFRQHSDVRLGKTQQRSGGRCTQGSLDVGGESWTVELYYIEESGAFRVHSFALQPPASIALAHLLPECGEWSGSRVGYKGPVIERATRPTR